jgi:hypothetical protein
MQNELHIYEAIKKRANMVVKKIHLLPIKVYRDFFRKKDTMNTQLRIEITLL